MRLHHLTVSAFGPFAGTEEVDFDELCAAGLFLLTGPTGAGKTTILDAVCFALYGSVPGVRGVKSLKSQHAGDDARPEVILDFSVRERRFVVRRSPEWSRPKRRGTGLTTENARATLVETTSGEDHLLSSRAQEVGHFVGELIGMASTQFVQVAMLPQGEFQTFLRASSQDRHDVLQHLFRTDRYARIEDWVHDHSRQLKEGSTAGRQAVVRVLDNVADRVADELPDTLEDEALSTAEAQERALSWVDEHVETAVVAHRASADQVSAAAAAARAARTALEDGLRLRDLHARRDEARSALDRLALDAPVLATARLALDADARASRCLPLLRLLADARANREHASRAWTAARADLARAASEGILVPEPVTATQLADLEQEARSSAARLEGLLPREQELLTARSAVLETTAELGEATALRDETTSRAGSLPPQLGEARTAAGRLRAVAARGESLSLEVEQARGRLEAARQAADCAASLPLLRDAERAARDAAADARDVVQDLTARRLAGIAAELAGKLVPGESCQVCGSTDHPAPATSAAAPVGELEQVEAAAVHEAAGVTLAAASGAVVRAEERLEGLQAAAGHQSAEAAAATLGRLDDTLGEAVQAQAALNEADALVEALTSEQQQLTARAHDLDLRVAGLAQTLEAHRRTIEVTSAELESQVDTSVPVRDQVAYLVEVADAFAAAGKALSTLDAAATKVDELAVHADASAREEGFDDSAAVQAAALTDDDRTSLSQLVEARDRTEAAARATLEDEALRGLGDSPVPDLTALADASDVAKEAETDATRRHHLTEEVLVSLRRQRSRLVDALATWAPLREEHLRAESMSKLVRGMGGDNQLQMRLSAYVLATRLDQVVAAANERLGHMRDQRFLLQRTGRVARKGAQAGLGLEVVDQWTGDVRAPTTLSGGETFVVSLALALGLADVVTQEAGGTEIETLFVDEGFGTLDADTLDDVMDRLDDLRAGGRAVGVVSHVSELRNRIPTQLHVEKGRTGSVVTVRTAVG